MNLSSGRILIVKTTSMGDVVHALPAVSDIRASRPGLTVDWLVEAPFAAIPRLHPAVARVVPIAWRRWRRSLGSAATRAELVAARETLRAERYDLVVDLQGLLKSALWGVQARGPLAGYDRASIREPLASFAYRRTAAVPRALHAVERCRRLVASLLGYAAPATRADFGIVAPGFARDAAWRPPVLCSALIPCASRPEKLWPEERWIEVGRRLARARLVPVVLWGSDDERARAERIAAGCGGLVPPRLDVAGAAAALGAARHAVGLDTGFTHLAAALRVPTIGIYADHDPGLAGVTGAAAVASFGGKGRAPELDDVIAELDRRLERKR